MREILFKAKRKDNGEWVYGWVHRGLLGNVWYLIEEYDSKSIEVISETICEYTGLTDKNGVKIFEGDIILIGEKRRKVEVIFKDGQFGFLYNKTCVSFQYQNPEVIGNIFDEEAK